MKLEEILLQNFGVYHGNVNIELPLDIEKNICLIDGNNGYGKTTLLKAVEYCLYGIDEKYSERLEYINHHALSSGNPEMSVSLRFIHNGRKYELTRRVEGVSKQIKTHNDVVENTILTEDGKEVVLKSIDWSHSIKKLMIAKVQTQKQ